MAFVQFRAAAVREYGLPQACPCCGNDDDGQLVLEPIDATVSRWKYGCCLISLFFGPLGWILGMLFYFRRSRSGASFPLPNCQLCRQAKKSLWNRMCVILILSSIPIFYAMFAEASPTYQTLGLLGFLAASAAIVEYFYLGRQFRFSVSEANQDMVLVEVPYEEYPALYQRHLDNAVLYGSSEKLGTGEER